MKLTLRTISEEYFSNPREVLPVYKEDGMHMYVYFHFDTAIEREEIVSSLPHDYVKDITTYDEDLLCMTLVIPIKGCKVLLHE